VILVSGSVEMIQPVRDEKKQITINAIAVRRVMQRYTHHRPSSKKEKVWLWRDYSTEDMVGNAKIGNIILDASILNRFQSNNPVAEDELNAEEIAQYHTLVTNTTIYLSDEWMPPDYLSVNYTRHFDLDPMERFYYYAWEWEKDEEMTIIGLQQGDKVIYSGLYGISAVREGIHSKHDIIICARIQMVICVSVLLTASIICLVFSITPAMERIYEVWKDWFCSQSVNTESGKREC